MLPNHTATNHRSQTGSHATGNAHLTLEPLEDRAMLSALAVDDPNAGGPAALNGVYDNQNDLETGSPTSSLSTAAPVPGAPEQMAQTFETLSSLEGGIQGPALAYQRVVLMPNAPNQPLPSLSELVQAPTVELIPSMPMVPARPFYLGGTGGDLRLNRATADGSIFQQDLQDEFWSTFENREAEGPASELPKQELIEQLGQLGEFEDLIDGDRIDHEAVPPPASALPHDDGQISPTPAGDDQGRDDCFDLDGERRLDDDLLGEALVAEQDVPDRAGEDAPQSQRMEQAEVRLPASSDWSDQARAAVGVALATLWATSTEDEKRQDRVAHVELPHQN